MTKYFNDQKVWYRSWCLVDHLEDRVFVKAFHKQRKPSAAAPAEEVNKPHVSNSKVLAVTSHVPARFDNFVREADTHIYTLIEYCAFLDSLLSDRKYHLALR